MTNSLRRNQHSRSVLIVACLAAMGAGACDSSGAPASGSGTGGSGAGTGGASAATGGSIATTGGAGGQGGVGGGGGVGGVRACGSGETPAAFGFRVEVPAGMPALAVAGFATVTKEIDGAVSAVARVEDPCLSCAGGTIPSVRIEVTEGEQKWAVVVLPGAAADAFETAASTLRGMPVKVLIRLRRAFQIMPSTAFTIRDAGGNLVMAVEAGPFVPTLESADLAPLTVENGANVCQQTLCGSWRWAYTRLKFAFAGGAAADAALGASADVTFGQRQYTARNVGGGYLVPETTYSCADVEHTRTWAIWSRPVGP